MGVKGRMLAVEIATRTIRVVEFVPGSAPIEVSRAVTFERPRGDPAAVAKVLKKMLAEDGFTAKRALVAYSGPIIEHRIYLIPPVFGETRNELLRGKVAQEMSTPIAEMCVSGEIVGRTSERGIERAEALAVYLPDFEIRRLTFLLIEAGISPARIATVPLALAALHPKEQENVLVGFIHAEAGRCSIAVSLEAKLRFAREFTIEHPQPTEAAGGVAVPDSHKIEVGEARTVATPAADEAAERVVTELTRSLLYFRQVSRGGSISKLYWSGELPSGETKALILQRLKLEISSHPAEEAASWPVENSGTLSEYAVPLGLARAGQISEQVNLLPQGYQRRQRRRSHLTAAVVVGTVYLLATGGIFAGLQNAQTRYREVIDQSEALTARRVGAQADFLRWIELRQRVEEAEKADRLLRIPFNRWKALLEWLGGSVPREMAFTSIAIDRTGTGYHGELRGWVRGKDPAEVQSRFNGFLDSVSSRSLGQGVLYAPIEVRPLRDDEGRGVIQEFQLTFTLVPEA